MLSQNVKFIYIFLELYNEKLVNEKKNFGKSKENYIDELNDKLKKKNEILSKINIQYEKIQRLMGELKFEKKIRI